MRRFDARPLLLTLMISATAFGQGQKARVHTQYQASSDQTDVAANVLYLLNTPEQFVELQLRGQYWGKRLLFAADEVNLEFYSFSESAKYRDENRRRLVASLDGKEFDVGPLIYKTISGDKARELLPKNARLSGKPLLEVLFVRVEPTHVALLAAARRVAFRLGDLQLALDDDQMSIVREFDSYVNRAPGSPLSSGDGVELLKAELPPVLENAPVNTILKWLEDNLFKHGVFSRFGSISRLVPGQFSDCKIEYRIVMKRPIGDIGTPYVIATFVNLADLDPDYIRAISYNGVAYVNLQARGGEQKIRGAWELSVVADGFAEASTTITLGDVKAAPGITAALARAIRLCQKP